MASLLHFPFKSLLFTLQLYGWVFLPVSNPEYPSNHLPCHSEHPSNSFGMLKKNTQNILVTQYQLLGNNPTSKSKSEKVYLSSEKCN